MSIPFKNIKDEKTDAQESIVFCVNKSRSARCLLSDAQIEMIA
jgi:hypothetical protein